MGQARREEHYEGRYSNQTASEKFTKLALIINGLGLTIGVPMLIWGIHIIGNGGNPWIAVGSFAGTIATEAVGTSILLRKT